MQYSVPDAGFVVRMRIGEDNVLAVIDSGSHSLGVATSDCIRKQLCSARDAGYNPNRSPTSVRMGRRGVLQYASLRIDSDVVRDDLRLQVVRPDREADLCGNPPSLQDTGALAEIEVRQTVVHAASAMEGTHSNVFGLMAPTDKCSHDEPCMISVLFDAIGCEHRWGLACCESGAGYLSIGAPSQRCLGSLHTDYIPFSRTFSYMGAYVVDVSALLVGPTQDNMQPVPSHLAPKHLVLDTGTADSYLTSAMSQGVLERGLPSTHTSYTRPEIDHLPCFALKLSTGHTIGWTPQRYMRNDGESGRFFTTLRTRDHNIDALFGAESSVMLLGISQMMGMFLEFDLSRKRVGFAEYETTRS